MVGGERLAAGADRFCGDRGVGVDGSWVIEMSDAKAPQARRLRAHGTGACVGCAYSAGAAYFESCRTASENEFEFCRGLERPIVREQEDDSRLRFHYDDGHGVRQDAVAIIGGDEIGYREMAVRGLDAALTDQILDAFGQRRAGYAARAVTFPLHRVPSRRPLLGHHDLQQSSSPAQHRPGLAVPSLDPGPGTSCSLTRCSPKLACRRVCGNLANNCSAAPPSHWHGSGRRMQWRMANRGS